MPDPYGNLLPTDPAYRRAAAPLRPVHAPADRDGIHQCCGLRAVEHPEWADDLRLVTCPGPAEPQDYLIELGEIIAANTHIRPVGPPYEHRLGPTTGPAYTIEERH